MKTCKSDIHEIKIHGNPTCWYNHKKLYADSCLQPEQRAITSLQVM